MFGVNRRFKRRKILINKKFQLNFIAKVYIMIVIVVSLLVGIFLFSSKKELGGSAYRKIINLRSTQQLLVPTIIKVSAVTLVAALVIVGIRFLFYSHKIAGPIYRFGRSFEDINNGDFTVRVKFREKDELQDMAAGFSNMIAEIDKKLLTVKLLSDQINDGLNSKKKNTEKAANAANKLKLLLDKLKL